MRLVKLISIIAVVQVQRATAFKPRTSTKLVAPSKADDINEKKWLEAERGCDLFERSTTFSSTSKALSLRGGASETHHLIVGYVMIVMAFIPYLLHVLFPATLEKYFFNPVYPDDSHARLAETGSKTRFATMSLALITLIASEVFLVPEGLTPERMLRDSYILFTLLYIEFSLKLKKEHEKGWVAKDSYAGAQGWHIFVIAVLVLNLFASESISRKIMSSKLAQMLPITWLLKKVGFIKD